MMSYESWKKFLTSGSIYFKLSFFLTTHIFPELGTTRHAHKIKKQKQNQKITSEWVPRSQCKITPGRHSYTGTGNNSLALYGSNHKPHNYIPLN